MYVDFVVWGDCGRYRRELLRLYVCQIVCVCVCGKKNKTKRQQCCSLLLFFFSSPSPSFILFFFVFFSLFRVRSFRVFMCNMPFLAELQLGDTGFFSLLPTLGLGLPLSPVRGIAFSLTPLSRFNHCSSLISLIALAVQRRVDTSRS